MTATTVHSRPDGHNHHRARTGPNTVKNPLTPNGLRPVVENDAYAAFARRILRAYARRIACGDIESLALMTPLPPTSRPPSARRSPACAPSATPGPTSAPGSASPAKPPSNAGEAGHRHRRDGSPHLRSRRGPGDGSIRRRHPALDRVGRLPRRRTPAHRHRRLPPPVRLQGRIDAIDLATGELRPVFDTAEPGGVLLTSCGNRRETVCPSCSRSTSVTPASSSARACPAAKASPSRSPGIRACSPPSPPRRSARCTPAGCAARPSCRAAPAATRRPPLPARPRHLLPPPPRRARPPARPGAVRRLLRLQRCRAVQRPRRGAVAPVHHLPAPLPRPPRRAGHSSASGRGSATSRSPNTRHAASSTSTPSSASTPPATPGSHPPPASLPRCSPSHRPGRRRRHHHHRARPPAAVVTLRFGAQTDARPVRHDPTCPAPAASCRSRRRELHRQVRHQNPRRPRPPRPAAALRTGPRGAALPLATTSR